MQPRYPATLIAKPKRHCQESGFTLLELMIVIAIAALLITIGVPSFNDLSRRMKTNAAASDLENSLRLARSEAIKSGQTVVFCIAARNSDNQATGCANASDWNSGWLSFIDINNNTALDANEAILHSTGRFPAVRIEGQNSLGSAVRFNGFGRPQHADNSSLAPGAATLAADVFSVCPLKNIEFSGEIVQITTNGQVRRGAEGANTCVTATSG